MLIVDYSSFCNFFVYQSDTENADDVNISVGEWTDHCGVSSSLFAYWRLTNTLTYSQSLTHSLTHLPVFRIFFKFILITCFKIKRT